MFACAATLALGPHLLRNAIYYKNPVYPLLMNVFTGSRPMFADSLVQMKYLFGAADAGPKEFWPRVWTSLGLTLSFPFAHTSLLGTLPLYGSLYTLLLPAVALSFRNRRLLLGAVLAWASVPDDPSQLSDETLENLRAELQKAHDRCGGEVVRRWVGGER